MNPHQVAGELLAPVLRVAMPRGRRLNPPVKPISGVAEAQSPPPVVKRYRTPFGSQVVDFLASAHQFCRSGISGGDWMKGYPLVEELLAPVRRVAMPRAGGSPAFLRR